MLSFIEFQLELAELPCIDGVYTVNESQTSVVTDQ